MKQLLISVLVCLAGLLVGCHTVQGVGEDVQAGGKVLTKSAS